MKGRNLLEKLFLSRNELAVLRILWETKEPLSRPEILEKMPTSGWNTGSIHSILNNLIKHNYIHVAGSTRCGQRYGRTYSASLTQEEYAAKLACNAFPDIPEEELMVGMMSAMVKNKGIRRETIELLEKMLEQHRKSINADSKTE